LSSIFALLECYQPGNHRIADFIVFTAIFIQTHSEGKICGRGTSQCTLIEIETVTPQSQLAMQITTAAYIFTAIENIEKELAFLKALVQQAISDGEGTGQEDIIVHAAYLGENDDDILTDAVIIADAKPAARTLTRKEQRDEGRKKAQEWAKSEMIKKYNRSHNP
jgi:hypothetical protein